MIQYVSHAEITIKGFYCNFNRLAEDEPLVLKHVEDVKKLKYSFRKGALLVCTVLFYSVKKCNKPLLINGNRIDVCFFMSVLTVSCHESIEITLLYPGFQCFRRDCKERAQVYLLYELYTYVIQEENLCIIISRRLFTHTQTDRFTHPVSDLH